MKKLLSYFRIYLLDTLTYRGDVLLFTISGIAQPLINIMIWLSVSGYAATPFSQAEFVKYFLLVMVIGTWTSAWAGVFVSRDIRLGNISPFLLKPVSFVYHQIANNIAEKTIKFVYLLPVVVLLFFVFNITLFSFNFLILPVLLLILFASTIMLFVVDMCIGFAAFWLDDSEALFDFFGIGMFFFSGRFIPLMLMPEAIQRISIILPFRYMLSFPVELILGKLSNQDIAIGMAIQLMWLMALVVLYRSLWIKGIKRYSAVGA